MRDSVTVVGSGMMGSGISAMAALAGNRAVLVDVDEARALAGLAKAVDCIRLREANGLCGPDEADRAVTLLSATADMASAMPRTRILIEAIVENLPVKQVLFQQLDQLLSPEVPICSNTSGLRITEISALCQYPERTMTTHFWLPAHLVPLVEVVMGDKTDECMALTMTEELKAWGKSPVLVRRDMPGQLANRIFQAIIREAVSIVASGLASAEDVDTAIGCGMAMRFPVWGPLMHLDAIGLGLGLAVQDSVLPSICDEKQASDYLRALVSRGETGAAVGKGFYDWSGRSLQEAMRKRDAFIIEAAKLKSGIDQGN